MAVLELRQGQKENHLVQYVSISNLLVYGVKNSQMTRIQM